MTGAWGDDLADLYGEDDAASMQRIPDREIYRRGGRYVMCQVLNWRGGPPPKYIVCNPLTGPDAGHCFLARQGMGMWMEADAYELAHILNQGVGSQSQ